MNLCHSFGYRKKTCYVTLLLALSTGYQVVQAAETSAAGVGVESSGMNSNNSKQGAYAFPRWPERNNQRKAERVPPPPPGPYMSSAMTLDGSAAENSPFARDRRSASVPAGSSVSRTKFSPETPWPSNSNSPHRWKPETGYRYVRPQVDNQVYPAAASDYRYGYRYPVMSPAGPVRQSVYGTGNQFQQDSYGSNRQAAGKNSAMQGR